MLAVEEKQKKEGKLKKKPKREHGGPKSRILNRKGDRGKATKNDVKSDESGDEVMSTLLLSVLNVLFSRNIVNE